MKSSQVSTVDMIADELIEVVEFFSARLALLDNETVRHKPSEERWSIAEVVGHLVDSAANNHQRFVRAQETDTLVFPKYDQNSWVLSQNYAEVDWDNLLNLWKAYNIHLAHVIRQISDHQMRTGCTITPNEPVSLSFLIEDYLVHLKHHINRINERVGF